MTNLKRYNLGSAADINWYESPTGNVCDAPEALAIIEALQAEIVALNKRISAQSNLISDDTGTINALHKRTVNLMNIKNLLDEKVADQAAQIAMLKLDNATIAGLALDDQNIFSYTEPVQ